MNAGVLLIASSGCCSTCCGRAESAAVTCLGQVGYNLVRARRHLCRAETGRHHESQTGLGCARLST